MKAFFLTAGRDAVCGTLSRAAVSGQVEVGGSIENHFADLLDVKGDIVEAVALDQKSYAALKTVGFIARWPKSLKAK